MFKVWYIFNSNGRLYKLFRYWKRVVDNYDTRSIYKLNPKYMGFFIYLLLHSSL